MLNSTRCLVLCASLAAPPSSAQTAPNTLSPAEQRAGWILLFDGVDKNAHWRTGITGTTNTWIVENATLANPPSGSGSELYTKNAYANFEFSLEWKVNIQGNSGIFFRVPNSPTRICASSEYAILDDENGGDRTAMGYLPGETNLPIKQTGDCYDLYVTKKDGNVDSPYVHVANPYNQWNSGVIWANGNFIENWLNGQKVVDYELGTPDWLLRFSKSKYYGLCPSDRNTWARHPTGLIGMQDHGGGLRVWFRNLKIRPFTPGEKLIGPLMTPNGGTFSGSVKVALDAAITGATIRYTLDGSDPTTASPAYSDTLTLSATATLKARTFRPRFPASDVASAVFTRSGTPILGRDLSAKPEVSITTGGGLRLRNQNRQSFSVEVYSLSGNRVGAAALSPERSEYVLTGLSPGLYSIRITRGDWRAFRKAVVP
jgi:hypothetical protein